jgi:hypothetical protein
MLKEYAVFIFDVEVEVKAAGFSKKWKLCTSLQGVLMQYSIIQTMMYLV